MYKYIRVESEERPDAGAEEQRGHFAVITMGWPEKRNALSEAHLAELLDAFQQAGQSDARGIILAHEGPVFSAGHDFSDMAGRDLDGMRKLLELCAELMQTIPALPQPVIAQVRGLATAGGCQLVASCDLAVASESSRFQVPGGRGGWFCTTPGVALARTIPRKQALEMLMTGEPIDAATALRFGLVNRVVADDQVETETRDLLTRATRGSPSSKAIGKLAFHQQVDMDLASAYDYATGVMAEASQTEDAQEGLRAFLEKRRPRFKS
jgi:enoyl-CoA hydratase/carnithine racemase